MLTQLYGDRMVIASATGCSSIYGANLPSTPYTTDRAGRGPAWANSLFEDNAEFGLGIRLGLDQLAVRARSLLRRLSGPLGDTLVSGLLAGEVPTELGLREQRERVEVLRARLREVEHPDARVLEALADHLVPKVVWLVGGDGWAYDIGYGGLDHVLASGVNVNVLVLDTEVYSNTGGQASKATPLAASAKFAAVGKATPKKDLGLLAMSYGHVYVAQVALGARDTQTLKALQEAASYPGPSLVIAYSHCIAHGYDMAFGAEQQKLATEVGHWPLYRYDPRRDGPPLQLDSAPPKGDLGRYVRNEARYRMVEQQDPAGFKAKLAQAQAAIHERYRLYQRLAGVEAPISPIKE